MTESISDRWSAFLASAQQGECVNLSSLALGYVERHVLRSLAKEGFEVPTQRALKETLEYGLKPIVRLAGALVITEHGQQSP